MSENKKGATVDDLVAEIEEVSDDISDVKLFDVPVLIIFAILFFIVALQFFTRYVLNDSLGWTEEIARYFLILLGFVGSITCVRKGRHIFLEFFYRYLPAHRIKPVVVAAEVITLGFFGYLGVLAIELAGRTASNMVSIALPKSIIYYIVAAACFLMVVFALQNLIQLIKKSAEQVAAEKHEAASEEV